MMRGYAIGLGAGTQVLTNVPWLLAFGAPGEFTRALLMAAGWVINLASPNGSSDRDRCGRPRAVASPTETGRKLKARRTPRR